MPPTTKIAKMTTLTANSIKDILPMGTHRLWALFLLLVLMLPPIFAGFSWGTSKTSWEQRQHDNGPSSVPEFLPTAPHVVALVGQTVHLPCRVRNLGDRVVSWIRTRDLHILTWETLVYTSDSRFGVLHKPHSDSWTLTIASAQPRDEGKYECQINTDPKMSLAVQLSVRDTDMRDSPWDALGSVSAAPQDGPALTQAIASIMGPKEQYVRQGSTVTFTCVLTSPYTTGRPPRSIDWFHAGRLVSILAARGGISIDTEKTEHKTTSQLTVAGVTQSDAGNYTCAPADTRPASVLLVVLQGERTEAMQRDSHHSVSSPSLKPIAELLFLTFWALHLFNIR